MRAKFPTFILALIVLVGLFFSFFYDTQPVRNFSNGFLVQAANITATVQLISLVQNDFQFYAPNTSTTPTDCWPPGSDYCLEKNNNLTLAAFPIHQGDIIRLRTSFTAYAGLQPNSFRFKLQFKTRGASCSANETWYDLGGLTSTAAWRGFDIPDLADDASIEGDPCMTDSESAGYYNESGETDWNSAAIDSGEIIEYDWVIQNNSADYGQAYCFRVVQVNASDQLMELAGYNRYIEIETLPQYVVTESSTTDYSAGGSFYLTNPDNTQFLIDIPQDYYTEDLDFDIYSFNKNDIVSVVGQPSGRQALGDYIYQAKSEADNFFYQDFNQNITLTLSYSDDDVSGYEESTLEIRRWTGSQWVSLTSTVDTANNSITAQTSSFSFFGIFGEEEAEDDGGNGNGNGGNGGGGGGGGGGTTPPPTTKVILQGVAHPNAEITILKDGQVIAENVLADSQANFKISLTTINPGTYTFGVWAEDSQGRRSITFSFTVTVSSGITTTISGIFIPPTIELEKTNIEQGETLNILGQTVPESEVSVHIESPEAIVEETTADEGGDWHYLLDTGILAEGSHTTRAKAETPGGLLSSYSKVLAFYIGEEATERPCPRADLNKDGKTNLVDFSILLYWWGKDNPCVDQNGDGKVNLVDFSIMLYWWTG